MQNHDLSKNEIKNLLPKWLKDGSTSSKEVKQKKKIYHTANQIEHKILYYHPSITTNDKHQTMKNYRKYVCDYNKKVRDINLDIKEYNEEVYKELKAKQLTFDDFNYIEEFQKANKKYDTYKYNFLVEQKNNQNGNLLLKRKVQTVKAGLSEEIFNTIIFFYQLQIERKNAFLLSDNENLPRFLQKLKLNYRGLKVHKINGIQRFDGISKKTIQNHIKRFLEAKILINYKFINQNKPVFAEINPEILVISDLNPQNRLTPQNQLIKKEPRKKLHNDTGSNFNEIKITPKRKTKIENKKMLTQNGNSDSLADGLLNSNSIYTISANQEKRKKVAAKKEKETIVNFSKQLEKKKPSIYQIPTKNIQKAIKSTISNQDFAHILIQQIILFAFNTIFKNHSKLEKIYTGNWINTHKILAKRFQINENFVNKNNQFIIFSRIIRAIELANKINTKNNFENILHPFAWFDPNRKINSDGGLEYILNKIRLDEKKKKEANLTFEKKYKKLKYDATIRKNQRYNRLFKAKLTDFNKKKITKETFYNYVSENLPKKYLSKILSI